MRAVTRPLLSRVTGTVLLLLAGLLVAAPPASAAESGTVTLTAACPYLGAYDAGVYVTESFSGLTATPYSYSVVATRTVTVGTDTIAPDSSGWYTEPDGSHASGPAYTFSYNGTGPTPVVAPGDTYHWVLYKTYGAPPVEVLSGDATVASPTGCATTPPPPPTGATTSPGTAPAPASFGSSPRKVTVDHHGRFRYSFAATPALPGTITVVRNGQVWAQGSVTVPGSGTDLAALRLTRKARHQLAAHHRARTAVTVVVSNAYGSTSAGTTLVLRWA